MENKGWYMATRQLNWKQPFELRGGGEVRLYDGEGGGLKPVHGAYFNGHSWVQASWDLYGYYREDGKECGLDLVNKQEDAVA